MQADDLLLGPRGRDLCWGLSAPGVAFSRDGALAALADAVAWAVYWQEPTENHLVRPGVSLQDVAERLAGGEATVGWEDPVALGDQHIVHLAVPGHEEWTPRPAGLRAGLAALADEAARTYPMHDRAGWPIDWRTVSAVWWSAPIMREGVHTTRAVDGVPFGLTLVEDDPGADRGRTWPVRTTRPPRVLEIGRPDDWVALVRRYPVDVTAGKRGDWWRATGRDGGWLIPDWPAVADNWDAVHLSIAGYLTTAGRPLDVTEGYATVLAGWDPDATFWFDDLIELAGPSTGWARDRDSLRWAPDSS